MNMNGNALFLVLIAVALFAALSYAITTSGRGGGGIDREQALIKAAELIQYASGFEQAATRMRLITNCNDNQYSFQRDWDGNGAIDDTAADAYNLNSPADKRCHFYDNNGGGIVWRDPDPAWLDGITGATWYFSNRSCIKDIGANGSGTGVNDFCDGNNGATDLIVFLGGIDQAICETLNESLYGDSTIPFDNAQYGGGTFTGTYIPGVEVGDVGEMMRAKPAYCFQASSASSLTPDAYVFYHLILAR